MKGSREKCGGIYWEIDCLMGSVSHFLSRGSKQRMAKKDEKNGKKGHKGKDSRKAWNSKKRKQYRRISAFSWHYNPPNDGNPCAVIPLGTNRFEIGKETCGSDYIIQLRRPSEVPPTVKVSSSY